MKWNAFSLFTPAFERMQKILFPINFRYWLKLGFVSLFAVGGSIGGGGGSHGGFSPQNIPLGANTTTRNITGNAIANYSGKSALWGIVGALVLLASAIGVAFTFISSIFSFIFIDALVKKGFTIRDGWKKYYNNGVSLFWFRIIVGFISFIITIVIFLPFLIHIFREGIITYLTQTAFFSIFIDLLPYLIIFMVWWAIFAFFFMLVYDFALAEQYFHTQSTKSALKCIWRFVKQQKAETALYTLAKIVFNIGAGVVAGIIGIIFILLSLLLGIAIFFLLAIFSKILAWTIVIIYALIAIYFLIILLLPLRVFLRSFSLLAYEQLTKTHVLPKLSTRRSN